MLKYPEPKSKAFMLSGEKVKLVICTKRASYDACLTVEGVTYKDFFNDAEPYDRKTHVFYFPKKSVNEQSVLTLSLKKLKNGIFTYSHSFLFGQPEYADENALLSEYDNGLFPISSESEKVAEGVTYTHTLYNDKSGAPVHVFITDLDPGYASVYVGTPEDSYESRKVRATIPDMVSAAVKNGRNICAAVNADYFDIFGDFHPSGLCVKNARTVANPQSSRNFIATLKDGSHIITSLKESPDILKGILHAASGLQMIVKDGKIFDYAPLEPFSFTRHPRTAVGVRKDGSVILIVVDGRIPDYSNGASLVDLAKLMISLGADRAINLDGGGSSAMYTMRNGELILHSRPADLFRPKAKLIRKDYNSLLVEIKNQS
ncbi:MAG: phosphodiester glycosidase family protein [Acutalibacteraceae bacterium]